MKKLDHIKLKVATQLAAGMLASPVGTKLSAETVVKEACEMADKLIDACTDDDGNTVGITMDGTRGL